MISQINIKISNVDVTLIAEAPKIAPYLSAMKAALSDSLTITHEQIGIKATTHEKLGTLGREEGIAAMAIATLYKANNMIENN